MAKLNPEELRRLARLGAVARLEQLRQEEAAIRTEFPELFGGPRAGGTRAGRTRRAAGGAARRRRKKARRPMSAEARKAVSARMRKYWAERRKARGGTSRDEK